MNTIVFFKLSSKLKNYKININIQKLICQLLNQPQLQIILIIFALSVGNVYGQFTGIYNFANVTSTSGTTDPTIVPIATGVTFSPFTSTVGPNPNASGRFSFIGWPIGATNGSNTFTGSINTSSYYQVSITVASGYTVSLSSITFTFQRSGTGIRQYSVRSNADSYVSNLSASISPANSDLSIVSTNIFQVLDATTSAETGSTITLSGSDFTNLSSGTTRIFRFYGWNAEASGGSFSIDDVLISGTATPTNSTVTFDANGGTGTITNQSASSATALTSNTFTRTGYTFAGWNTAANGSGTAYADGASFPFTANTTLYAQWTVNSSNNCPSGTSISPMTDQTVCQDISTTNIATTVSYSGGTGTPTDSYQWYYNATNSNTISGATAVSGATNASFTPLSSSNEVGTRYYFCVAYATDNSCAQSATDQSLASSTVKIVVNGIPAAPSGSATQSMCTGQTVSNLNANGTAIKWYSTSSGGSALNSSSPLSTTNYYASQTVNGCESSNRLAVAATVNTIPTAPTGSSTQTFCSGSTVSNLSAAGTAIQWYSASSGGSALNSSSPLSTANYYASQTVNGCESSNRLAVATTVNSISIPTNLVSSNANCSSFDLAWDAVNCASGYKLDVFNYTTSNQILINNSGTTGSSGWIETSITQASGYITMLSSSSTLTTPSIDLSNATNSNLNFKVRTFGGISGSSNVITVSISTDNGTTWTSLGTKTAANNTLTSITPISLSSYNNSSQVKVRFQTLSATGTIGIGIDDIIIDKDYFAPLYISGYQDLNVSTTSKSVTGLSPSTKYYYRVRSTDGTNTSSNSVVDSITTPALSLTTDGIIVPFCFGTATSSSLIYTAANDNPNSYSIDWNSAANTAGLSDQTATSFTSSTSGGSITSIAIASNVPAGTFDGIMTITNTAGCSITKNVSLTINALPTIAIAATPSSAIVCSGSNVSLTASGANTYSWSGGISNGTSFSVSTPTTYTVTGTDANGCSATANKTVNYFPANNSVALASTSVSGAIEQCTESDGFTYYANSASPGQYLFGINKNGYNFNATVSINVDNVNKYIKSVSSNGANQEHASYTLSRYWNVTTTGTVGPGIKIRFFVDPQDISDMQNARTADYNSLQNTNPNTLAVEGGTEYFKSVGSSYSPSNWTGNRYNGTILKLTEDAIGTLNGLTYVELSGISSFSGGTIGTSFGPSSNNFFNSNGIVGLPVTWKDVNATAKEAGNHIEWSTSSEKNTKSFVVEYSYDAKEFFEASKDILAAGNSATDKFYEFNHDEEFGEMVYYRIKQIDLDGKIDYSKVVFVKRTSKLPEFRVSMYPVPLNIEALTLQIQTIQKTTLAISISDLLGREVYNESFMPSGYTTYHKMNLSHLQQGTYNVTINNGSHKTTQVLVIGK